MGCGCGNNKPAARNVRNLTRKTGGILNAVDAAPSNPTLPPITLEEQIVIDEKIKIQKLKRNAVLRALNRP